VHLVAELVAEEKRQLVHWFVRLGEQDRVAAPPRDERAEVAQVVVRVADGRAGSLGAAGFLLDQEGRGIHTEARQPELQPEPDDPAQLVADVRVVDVEVGLVGHETVHVPAVDALVVRPDRLLDAGEDHAFVDIRRLLVRPDVEIVERRVAVARLPEPWVVLRRVVHDEVGDHPDAAAAGGPHEVDEITQAPEPWIDAVVVADVVAVVAVGRRVERLEPDARDADAREVVDLLGRPGEVADAVAVEVAEGVNVEAVDDRVLPPQVGGRRYGGLRATEFPHPQMVRGGRPWRQCARGGARCNCIEHQPALAAASANHASTSRSMSSAEVSSR
jgi:hypothetical protein